MRLAALRCSLLQSAAPFVFRLSSRGRDEVIVSERQYNGGLCSLAQLPPLMSEARHIRA